MTRINHIVNGQSTLFSMEKAGVADTIFSMDDILMEGPVVNGLESGADWSFRAAVLQEQFGIPAADYLDSVQRRQGFLETACAAGDVVLWFEEDLFCQINFLYLIHWFAQHPPADGKLWYICPAEDRLGQLQPEALAALLPHRQPVTPALLETASAVWQAYCSSNPARLQLFSQESIPAWPLLQWGLRSHLQRFPSTKNGLNVLEHEILTSLNASPLRFKELFPRVNERPKVRPYGLGDLQVMRSVLDLATPDKPLLTIEPQTGRSLDLVTQQNLREARLQFSPHAEEALAGRLDWPGVQPIDRWLGGVHLAGVKPAWRWDEANGCLVGSPPQ